jgi:hypothetical protein
MPEDRAPVAPTHGTLTASQRRNRDRAETVIGLMAPFLDLVLAIGDRISRIAEPEDHEYYPVRAEELPGEERKGAASGD